MTSPAAPCAPLPGEDDSPSYVLPAIAGGLIGGLLSGGCGGCCCAPLWGGLGGLVAALLAGRGTTLFGPTEGALAGGAAGAVAALAHAGVAVPLQFVMHRVLAANPRLFDLYPAPLRDAMRQQLAAGVQLGPLVLGIALASVVLVVFSLIGGAIGGAVGRRQVDD